MHTNYYAIIMAGGGGTRLWPLSRKSRPKQVLNLVGKRSLFQTAVDRLERVFPLERILVVTVQDQVELLHEQVPQIPRENFIIEPLPRGTASVVGMAAIALETRDPDAVMAILTADHVIKNEAAFKEYLQAAYQVAQDGYLVTLGITPTHPATGYGYIQRGSPIGTFRGKEVYEVAQFTEKPGQVQAEKILASGEYAWNSGMFIWRVERIRQEFKKHMPEFAVQLEEIAADWGTGQQEATLARVWPEIEPETIDFGVMEKAERVTVLPARDLGWYDVGSWDALFDILDPDARRNVVRGAEHFQLDTSGALINTTENFRTVVTIGMENVVIVDTGDVLFMCDMDQAQRVREIVQLLDEQDRLDLL